MAAPASKVEVRLSAPERAALQRLVRTGTHSAHANPPRHPLINYTSYFLYGFSPNTWS
jgi:hypothetical protein